MPNGKFLFSFPSRCKPHRTGGHPSPLHGGWAATAALLLMQPALPAHADYIHPYLPNTIVEEQQVLPRKPYYIAPNLGDLIDVCKPEIGGLTPGLPLQCLTGKKVPIKDSNEFTTEFTVTGGPYWCYDDKKLVANYVTGEVMCIPLANCKAGYGLSAATTNSGSYPYGVPGTGNYGTGYVCQLEATCPISDPPFVRSSKDVTLCEREIKRNKVTQQCGPGNPIDPATGDKFRIETDLAMGDFQLTRYYHSLKNTGMGTFGVAWHSNLDATLKVSSTDGSKVIAHRPNGATLLFTGSGTGNYQGESDNPDTLQKLSDGSWKYFDSRRNVTEIYNAQGLLSSWQGLGQGKLTLSYASSEIGDLAPWPTVPKTITDSFGREFRLDYNGPRW